MGIPWTRRLPAVALLFEELDPNVVEFGQLTYLPRTLEPEGGHGGGFGDDTFLYNIFDDADNEVYPWLFEGIEPSLGRFEYDRSNGNVKIDATSAPGGTISKFQLTTAGDVRFNQPITDEINGDPLNFDSKSLDYTASNSEGFTEILDLGNILPPGLDFVELHDSLAKFSYRSPNTQNARVFRLVQSPRKLGSADFDNDGSITITDLNLLVGEIDTGVADLRFDVSGDGLVDAMDITQWLNDAATYNGFSQPFLVGDSNLDGVVNALDLNNLALNWQTDVALWSSGDFKADGTVNSGDLNALALNWQQSIPLAAAPIPEPSAMIMMLLAGLATFCRRRSIHNSRKSRQVGATNAVGTTRV